ncbi:Protein of unknown function [Haloarcula vallismortis]|uniref:DUF4013 domain-containing protein n=2 Tax=Haloarcula vallismortis TaxID=28442 RepID=M0J127_HALVA|nr:DUF4013 domain-containing protein [Haloarcula vallismortis]EMA02023.1 hypothetical protein C437_16436 [Haloarcula vallismortis ATCC 29715]SDW98825.1 Protein of unknown function [Haloarcula vallismortis]
MLEDAIRYPWNGEQKVETILIGGVLSLLGVFFIPVLFVFGYLVRVIRAVTDGDDEVPPVFEEWGDLLIEGLVAFLISLVYSLVPLVVIGLAIASFILPFSVVTTTGGEPSSGIAIGGLLLALVIVFVTVVVSLGAAYLLPAAVAAYAVTGRVGAAFSPGTLRAIGGSGTYAVAWLVAVAIGIGAQVLGGLASATVLGAVLVPFVSFYGNVAGAYAIGTAMREVPALGLESETRASRSVA